MVLDYLPRVGNTPLDIWIDVDLRGTESEATTRAEMAVGIEIPFVMLDYYGFPKDREVKRYGSIWLPKR